MIPEKMTMALIGGCCAAHGWWDRGARSVRRVSAGTPGAASPMPGQPFWAEYGPILIERESCPGCAAEGLDEPEGCS